MNESHVVQPPLNAVVTEFIEGNAGAAAISVPGSHAQTLETDQRTSYGHLGHSILAMTRHKAKCHYHTGLLSLSRSNCCCALS